MNRILAAASLLLALTMSLFGDDSALPSGRWNVTADLFGTPRYFTLQLEEKAGHVTGQFIGNNMEGTFDGTTLHVIARDKEGGTDEITAAVAKEKMTGTLIEKSPDDPNPLKLDMTAVFVPPIERRAPQRHDFTPTVFYRQFSPFNKPVLTVAPGDTIHTTTVDAGGSDEKGVQRVAGGNPQTGPFYIEGAMPGDTLVVHITRLRLNRDWAISDDDLVSRATNTDLAVKFKDNGKSVRWKLDTAKGTASLATPGEHLGQFTVPLRPMLGCIATAPPPGMAPPGTGDSSFFGGNMDSNEIVEGSTVYLPVMNPGALLYLGDGHALQGDGELNGNALETSMDVEFMVDVIPNKRLSSVRVETPTHIIAMGLSGSIDDAFKEATRNMADWLDDDYKFSSAELGEVLGVTAEYHISEVADRNAGVILKISKERLAAITKAK
jgi:amidase